MLLFGCGVGEKDSIPKTEETSKQDKKIKVSEEKYPYYVMERMVDFNSQLDSYSQTVQRVFKGGDNE